jgi:hypothetical protein
VNGAGARETAAARNGNGNGPARPTRRPKKRGGRA